MFRRLAATALLCATLNACSAPLCEDVVVGKAPEGLEVKVGSGEVKRVGGEFFGFNLENVEFQLSLWDRAKRRVRPEVVEALSAFPGAVYRFPGGTTANYYRWADGTGEVSARRPVKIVDWTDLPRIDFGIDEYLDFVAQVNGQPWYVLNLQGSLDKPADLGALATEAKALARHLQRKEVRPLRWELGNELDRAHDMWPSDKYLEHARVMLGAVRSVEPDARFVGMMADYDAQKSRGVTSSQYNKAVAAGLKGLGVDEYEQHLYYDGPPDGPNLPNRLRQLCRSMQDARDAQIPAKRLAFWVTEHGRWPQGDPGKAWKLSWNKTADVGAAIGVADLLIALTQIPEVRGSAIHALHGTNGPWPMFHPTAGPESPLTPSVTLQAYSLLRGAMLPVVLSSKSSSASRSGYEGGYDARGTVFTTEDRDRYSAWVVNRGSGELVVTLDIAQLAGRRASAELESVSAPDTAANNYQRADAVPRRKSQVSIRFDDRGRASYKVPAQSVSALSLKPAD